MQLDATTIAAFLGVVVATVGVVVAIATIYFAWRQFRLGQRTDIALRLDERFNSDSFKAIRRKAAKELLHGEDYGRDRLWQNLDTVLDHFELLGLLRREGVLDLKMAWALWYYWFHRYYERGEGRIVSVAEKEEGTWENLKQLHDEMVKLDRRQFGVKPLCDRDLTEFLEFESEL